MSKKIIILKLLPDESYCMSSSLQDGKVSYLYVHGDWDPEDWKEVQKGAEFYLIQNMDSSSGISMHGTIYSDAQDYGPYPGTEKGMVGTHLQADLYIDIDKYRLLSTSTLQSLMPDFDWTAPISGHHLPEQYAAKLHQIWHDYLTMNDDFIDNQSSPFKWIPNDNQ